jgi:hypothetical protein
MLILLYPIMFYVHVELKGEMMKLNKEEISKELSRKTVNQLVKKIYLLLKAEKKYTIEEKFAAGIIYSKFISDSNHGSREDFLYNVNAITMDEDAMKKMIQDVESTENMYE